MDKRQWGAIVDACIDWDAECPLKTPCMYPTEITDKVFARHEAEIAKLKQRIAELEERCLSYEVISLRIGTEESDGQGVD